MSNATFEVKSYPTLMAVGLGLIPCLTLYQFLAGKADAIALVMGCALPLVFLCLFDYKRTIFDRATQRVVIETRTPLKHTTTAVSFAEIMALDIVTGTGQRRHRGYIRLKTKDGLVHKLTSGGALGMKKQETLLKAMQDFLAKTT